MDRVQLLQEAMLKMADYWTSEAQQNPVARPAGQVVIKPPTSQATPRAQTPKVMAGSFKMPGGGVVKVGHLVPASERDR